MLDSHTMPCGQLQSHSTELNNISDPFILIIPSAVSIMQITKLWNTYKRRYSRQSSLVLRYKIILEYAKVISMIKVMIKTGQINRERCSVQSGMDTGLACGCSLLNSHLNTVETYLWSHIAYLPSSTRLLRLFVFSLFPLPQASSLHNRMDRGVLISEKRFLDRRGRNRNIRIVLKPICVPSLVCLLTYNPTRTV